MKKKHKMYEETAREYLAVSFSMPFLKFGRIIAIKQSRLSWQHIYYYVVTYPVQGKLFSPCRGLLFIKNLVSNLIKLPGTLFTGMVVSYNKVKYILR